jgi:RNA polymerase sigma-70 factor, ECF subfamily
MMTCDDEALLAQIAEGDQEALRELYTRYRPRVRRYLWYQLHGDHGCVEEALQDIFLAVWRSAGKYRGEARVATWLFQIAHYHVLHARRDASRRITGQMAPDPTWQSTSHEDAVLDRLVLAQALARLSAKHREVLELIFVHGFAPDEVAQILEVPSGTIESRVSYARRALRSELSAAKAGEGEPR